MKKSIVVLLLHIFFLSLSYAPGLHAEKNKASIKEASILVKVFEEVVIENNFKIAKNSFNNLAETKEAHLSNIKVQNTLKHDSNIGFYRVLAQVADDAQKKIISNEAGKHLIAAGMAVKMGRLEDAFTATNNAIMKKNLQSYPNAHFLIGRIFLLNCLQNSEFCMESLRAHHIALKYNPSLIYSYLDMGSIYMKNNRLKEAIKIYKKASTLQSKDGTLNTMGWAAKYGRLKPWTNTDRYLHKTVSRAMIAPENITNLID